MKKKLHGFSYDKNMANFEAFYREKTLAKPSYLCGVYTMCY